MIFLIGVYHRVQYINKYTDRVLAKEFSDYLEEQSLKNNVVLIAEEFNQEELALSNTDFCVARNLAEKLEIEHRLCDPDSIERESLRIPPVKEIKKQLGLGLCMTHDEVKLLDKEQEKYFLQKELFWLNKIKDKLSSNLIFNCGDKHIKSFQELLIENGCKVEVLNKGWGKLTQ